MELILKIIYILKVISLSISTFLFVALLLVILRSRFIQDIWSLNFRFRNLTEPLEFDYEFYYQKWEKIKMLLEKNSQQALLEALSLLERYLDYLGYEGENLQQRIKNVPKEKLTFYEDILKVTENPQILFKDHLKIHEAIDKIKFTFKELELDLESSQI